MRTTRSAAGWVVAGLLLSACGSTVASTAQAGPSQNSLGGPVSAAAPGATTASGALGSAPGLSAGAPGAAAPGTAAYQLRGSAGVTSVNGQSGAATGPAVPGPAANGNGPGITAKTINVGLLDVKNEAAAQAALGNTAVTSGDTTADQKIVLNDINAHGGIAGRKLVAVWHSVDATSTDTTAQADQAACSDWTQDHKVFAVIGVGTPDAWACLLKAGAVVGTGSVTGTTEAEYNQFSTVYDVSGLSLDRVCANLVPTLSRAKYFTAWNTTTGAAGVAPVKVGLVAPDKPEYRFAVDKICLPALRNLGVSVSSNDVYFYAWPQSSADDGQTVTDIQSAVLRFRQDGVTHVIPLEVNGQAFFGEGAENQKYFPRYGVDSASGTQAYNGSLLRPNQLNGAVGLGFAPGIDLPANMNPDNGPYSSAARRQCVKLMAANGQSFSSTNAEAVALTFCDAFYDLRAVIDSIPAGSPIDQAAFLRSLDAIGSLPAGSIPAAFFGLNHHDAADEGWIWQYFSDCQCLHYTGGPFRLS